MQALPQIPEIRYLKGIGPKRALTLEKVGVRTVRDLFYYFPRRYEDRSCFKSIQDLIVGEPATVKGRVLSSQLKRLRHMALLEVWISDGTTMMPALWFNQRYLSKNFHEGQEVVFYGTPEIYQGRLQFASPEYEILDTAEGGVHTGRITPVYSLTEGLFQKTLRSVIFQSLETHLETSIVEYLHPEFRHAHQLIPLAEAIREMHFPESFERLERARRRIIFDEFFIFQVRLLEKIAIMKSRHKVFSFPHAAQTVERFRKTLPFQLTAGQEEALLCIVRDLGAGIPMNRLLMGDVGSGKTVVAAALMAMTAAEKFQAAFLVPTEILAQQHFASLKTFLTPMEIEVRLLTAGTPAPAREKMLAGLAQGKIAAVVGTHALLQEEVRFQSLASVIVDEQHKFGVYQRSQLLEREPRPHQLVMTATPIPRTLALTVYGDLDVSSIRTLPAGRKPVTTYWINRRKQAQVFSHILERLEKGDQAYFIYPLIEDTEKSDMLAATEGHAQLSRGVFKSVRTGLVHGRMNSEEREGVMKDFKAGLIKVLVATSVIEVGVDNPNATVMVIENAERFGLSQLHQMRGRIGRGDKPSECFLFGEPGTDEGKKRLRLLTQIQDGFRIAEEDLKLRGPGDFWGARQSGDPLFRVAHPVLDQAVLEEARKAAQDIVHSGIFHRETCWSELKKYLDHFPVHY